MDAAAADVRAGDTTTPPIPANAKAQGVNRLLGPLRIPFLVLTPASVVLGWGAAVWLHGAVDLRLLVIVMTGALSAHVSVNAFNEYFDFKSGLDARTRRTPFSGGSGTLPVHPELAGYTLGVALVALALTLIVGLYLVGMHGVGLLPIGLLGVLTVLAYTPWINRSPLLSLLAPGLGFGPLMVLGTYFVLTGGYSLSALAASAVPFFLVNGLLLLNQFPDVEADRHAGRRNLPIVLGRRPSSLVFAGLLLLAFGCLVTAVGFELLPTASLLGLAGVLIAAPALVGAWRHADRIGRLVPYMALNVAATLTTTLLVAFGLFVA